jgi:single-stranded-DNA-specific exonuclease
MKKTIDWKLLPRTESGILNQLLKNRHISLAESEKFFNPDLSDLEDPLSMKGVKEAKDRILQAIKSEEKIIIYGDYDVDGVSATAVLWEAIDSLGGKVLPYIPDRFSEGYGINEEAIKKLAGEGNKLIVSVDSGITAYDQIALAKKLGVDFIITDHHSLPAKLPPARAIVHTTNLAGVGVAYKMAQALIPNPALELVALGTVADVMPMLGENRILTKFGIEGLRRSSRPGLLAMYEEAGISPHQISTYEIGFIIGPRLNAMGRLEHALDSLRILLTRDPARAKELAKKLGATNEERRRRTLTQLGHARESIGDGSREKLWVVSHDSYEQGIIGLIAGRLTDEWHRPVIAISEGQDLSRGSARSISGFNVVQAIAEAKELLVTYGGHPQAAGFTIETKNIPAFRKKLQRYIETKVHEDDLRKQLIIDAEIKPDEINMELARQIERFAPFGVENPQPTFITKGLAVGAMRLLSEGKHIRVDLGGFETIGFGMGERGAEIRPDMRVNAVFNLEINNWQDRERLQLKLRDFKVME